MLSCSEYATNTIAYASRRAGISCRALLLHKNGAIPDGFLGTWALINIPSLIGSVFYRSETLRLAYEVMV